MCVRIWSRPDASCGLKRSRAPPSTLSTWARVGGIGPGIMPAPPSHPCIIMPPCGPMPMPPIGISRLPLPIIAPCAMLDRAFIWSAIAPTRRRKSTTSPRVVVNVISIPSVVSAVETLVPGTRTGQASSVADAGGMVICSTEVVVVADGSFFAHATAPSAPTARRNVRRVWFIACSLRGIPPDLVDRMDDQSARSGPLEGRRLAAIEIFEIRTSSAQTDRHVGCAGGGHGLPVESLCSSKRAHERHSSPFVSHERAHSNTGAALRLIIAYKFVSPRLHSLRHKYSIAQTRAPLAYRLLTSTFVGLHRCEETTMNARTFVLPVVAASLLFAVGCANKDVVPPVNAPLTQTTSGIVAPTAAAKGSGNVYVADDIARACKVEFNNDAKAPKFDFDQSALLPQDRAVLEQASRGSLQRSDTHPLRRTDGSRSST